MSEDVLFKEIEELRTVVEFLPSSLDGLKGEMKFVDFPDSEGYPKYAHLFFKEEKTGKLYLIEEYTANDK